MTRALVTHPHMLKFYSRSLDLLEARCMRGAWGNDIKELSKPTVAAPPGAHFTCFTGTKVQMLTPEAPAKGAKGKGGRAAAAAVSSAGEALSC